MSNLILEAVQICDSRSPFQGQQKHLLIENGYLSQISDTPFNRPDIRKISASDLMISPIWTDIQTFNGVSGYEYKETLETLSKSALSGGFGRVIVLPNTQPVLDTKSAVTALRNQVQFLPIEVLPMGAISKNAEGKEIAELFDLQDAGVVAFSDGLTQKSNLKLLKNVLQYLQHFDAQLIITPYESTLSANGQMHEGENSARLGMVGIPRMTEKIAILNALEILRYTGGKLHFSKISTNQGVDIIRQAKADGLSVTADTEAYRFAFTDADLFDFDTNLKVQPPFRTTIDQKAILEGLKDGTIDTIISAHLPQDIESKRLEFNLAEFGIIGLETAYASLRTFTDLSSSQIIEKLSIKSAELLKLPLPKIEVGKPANFTLFDENQEYIFAEKDIQSKSTNTPFIGKKLKGKVKGVFTKGQFSEVNPN